MRTKVTIACATTLLLQIGIPVFAAPNNTEVAVKPGTATTAASSADSSTTVDTAISSAAQGTSPSDVVALEILRDGLAAPLVYLTPEMPLNAAYLLPIGDPANLLRGEAKVTDPASDNMSDTTSDTCSDAKAKDGQTKDGQAKGGLAPVKDGQAKDDQDNDDLQKNSQTADVKSAPKDGPIVIDNDLEKEEAVTEYVWKEIPDSEGKMHIDAGGRFPVTVITSHTSKTAKIGDPVEARLKVDIKIGGRLIAPKGAKVMGHIASCEKARKMIQAEFSTKRWMRPSGALGVQFDEILTASGEHIPLVAMPAQQPRIVKNLAEGRVLGVNHKGEIVSPLSAQVKAQAAHMGIRAAASAAGPFSFGIVPVAYGVAGAISPSFAYMHPVGKNVRHRRLKGFGLGVVSGLPGGFLVADYIIRGEEAIIKPGDEFLAEFKQKFTGEASADAQLMPGAKAKVHGEVLPEKPKN